MNKEEISFIIEFDEMNKEQQNTLWNYLLSSGFKWHVLEGNDDFIENTSLKQKIQNTIQFCNYLLENNEIEIDNNKYFKHECDDIITNEILKKLTTGDTDE